VPWNTPYQLILSLTTVLPERLERLSANATELVELPDQRQAREAFAANAVRQFWKTRALYLNVAHSAREIDAVPVFSSQRAAAERRENDFDFDQAESVFERKVRLRLVRHLPSVRA
jgi:hypothetical protein